MAYRTVVFRTLEGCLASREVARGNIRVRAAGATGEGIFVPPQGDSARPTELEQVRAHFRRHKVAG